MAKLTFYGATGTVTGSRFVLETDTGNMLIDCGMFQGRKENRVRNWDPFPFPPAEIDKVLLTHAHIDHAGYIPRFCKGGFDGEIHCTHATSELCDIMLKDSAHIQEEDANWANKKGFSKHEPAKPLYTVEEAVESLKFFSPVHLGQELFWGDNMRIKFRDSGHILGSAFIDIKTRENNHSRKILFSGDIGRASRPILRDPVQVYNIDYLVMESTYGDRLHEDKSPHDELARVINESVNGSGVLVIPAFAVGRTQTLLYVIRELEEQKRIPIVPIYVDSPMALEATEVFYKYIPILDLDSRIEVMRGKDLFRPANLHLSKTREQSIQINDVKGPAIIISASGMVIGGRILHHMIHRLDDPRNTVLLVGYQPEGTRGRSLMDGEPHIKIHGQHIPVRARIENILGFSGHADYNEIMAWLMGLNRAPEKTFLVHGEPEASVSLAEKLRTQFGWDVVVPQFGESFEIDL
jgi:metallo-beta-lactamase family protein